MAEKVCVLVCVTRQISCERLIKAGAAIAKQQGMGLNVINVCPEKECANLDPEATEHLYACCKEVGADMDIVFSDNPAMITAAYAMKSDSRIIVTGFPGEKSSGFVASLRALLPKAVISMVDEDGRIYNMIPDAQNRLSAAMAK